MRYLSILAVVLLFVHGGVDLAAGETVRIPITRDTWVSSYPTEQDANTGGATRLKLKSYQEMSLLDFDPAPLVGRTVESATLHVKVAGTEPLFRVTVGTISAPWVEGTSPRYAPQEGSSSFRWRKNPDVPWTDEGGDICSVILDSGGSFWRMADAAGPDPEGWCAIPVEPAVIAARAAGVSHGLILFDDLGTEWMRNGDQLEERRFPNRFLHSRESGEANAPYLTVELGPRDDTPPGAPRKLRHPRDDFTAQWLPMGEAIVRWTTPDDSDLVGFRVTINDREVPRWMIPTPATPNEDVRMHVRGLGLAPGVEHEMEVRAVDAAGNEGPPLRIPLLVSAYELPKLPPSAPAILLGRAPLRLGDAEVFVVDALDKIDPVTGEFTPPQDAAYELGNHLFDAERRLVRLAAAQGEFIAFQIVVRGEVDALDATLRFREGRRRRSTSSPAESIDYDAGLQTTFLRPAYVPTKNGARPDPLIPMAAPLRVPDPAAEIRGQRYGSVFCELYVPHYQKPPEEEADDLSGFADEPTFEPGTHYGELEITGNGESVVLNVALRIWDFHLPDHLSFLPEMNCYGLPENELGYYQLAHAHRTVLNRVPYSQSGAVAEGCAPTLLDDGEIDWRLWDERFAPLFTGEAFNKTPRKNVPIECFYLPLHENWPTPMEGSYNESYWADEAFPAAYRKAFEEVSRQFTRHFAEKGYDETIFQCLLNNKRDFKRQGWSRGSSPWLLDEPGDLQDFWALRYFGEAFIDGAQNPRVGPVWRHLDKVKESKTLHDQFVEPEDLMIYFRADISRPQWQRGVLDHVLAYNVVQNEAFHEHHDLVMERKRRLDQLVLTYGSSNAIDESNVWPAAWCVDSWSLGADGVIPWQTVGNANSWTTADTLALLYPGESVGSDTPIPSIRLKAFRRGQQDVEYLTLLQNNFAQRGRVRPREPLGRLVRELLHLDASDGAKEIAPEDLKPQDLWSMRFRIGQTLDAAKPSRKDKLVDRRLAPRDEVERRGGRVDGCAPPEPR